MSLAGRAAVAGMVLISGCHATASTKTTPPMALDGNAGPVLGVLEVDGAHYPAEKAAGIRAVTINVGWTNMEPTPGQLDRAALAGTEQQIKVAREDGFAVILDPGIQYPPAWVFGLGGGTQFVDQYGDAFTGDLASGNHVANAVTDPAVRSALGTYLRLLGQQLPRNELTAVRQGGGPTGELRYPDAIYNGHQDCWWAYDSSTQASSPVPGWFPGTGTTAQAAQFIAAYNANLVSFGKWMNAQFSADFATTNLVMLPGWGERPGAEADIVGSRLTESKDEWNEGLDWTDLLGSLPDPASSVAYTTYLDAPSFGSSLQSEDPAMFMAALAGAYHLRSGGENTGNGTVALLDLSLTRAVKFHFVIVNWMSEGQLVASSAGQDPKGPGFAAMAKANRTILVRSRA